VFNEDGSRGRGISRGGNLAVSRKGGRAEGGLPNRRGKKVNAQPESFGREVISRRRKRKGRVTCKGKNGEKKRAGVLKHAGGAFLQNLPANKMTRGVEEPIEKKKKMRNFHQAKKPKERQLLRKGGRNGNEGFKIHA